MKIVQIVGARPQFVKLAPLSKALRQSHQEIIIHSGQHYDIQMNEVFFQDMQIPAPDHNLSVGSGTQAQQTAEIMLALEPILAESESDAVIVYGDTNTTLAGALVAAKLGLKTVHVESCLRSYNRTMPEEINRIVTDHVSDILLCPTATAMDNAQREGLSAKCHLVGDIMVDSLLMGSKLAAESSNILHELHLEPVSFSLLTLHRPYNVDDPKKLKHILTGLNQMRQPIVFPVHPRTRNILAKLEPEQFDSIRFIEPLSYLDFIQLMSSSVRIITDSGGIQKEAYILRKPCITLRSETEWAETVSSGWNLLLPVDSMHFPDAIINFSTPDTHPDIFGNNVAKRIVTLLETLIEH